MFFAIYILAIIAISHGGVVSRKSFNDNFQDFLDTINAEVGDNLMTLASEYEQDTEYLKAFEYLQGSNFVDILSEMEHLPEFQAVTDFLEADEIHIYYYLDIIHQALGKFDGSTGIEVKKSKSLSHRRRTGTGFNGMLRDFIDILPKEKLAALYDQKIADDEDFRVTMSNLQGEEFSSLWTALWENEVFQAEVKTLSENGISVQLLVEEVMALFGQN